MVLSLLSARTLISSCFFAFLPGAATTLARLAILPNSVIASTIDKARMILSYFLYNLSRSFLSTEIYFWISLIFCNLNTSTPYNRMVSRCNVEHIFTVIASSIILLLIKICILSNQKKKKLLYPNRSDPLIRTTEKGRL